MAGYRPDDDWSKVTVDATIDRRVTPIAAPLGLITIKLIYDILSWTSGGGTISIVRAFIDVRARVASIDVDQSGLTSAALLLLCASFVATCRVLGVKKISRSVFLLSLLSILAVTFALGWVCGEQVITSYMAAQDYRRCPSRDHSVGHFRDYIAFNNYALAGSPCL